MSDFLISYVLKLKDEFSNVSQKTVKQLEEQIKAIQKITRAVDLDSIAQIKHQQSMVKAELQTHKLAQGVKKVELNEKSLALQSEALILKEKKLQQQQEKLQKSSHSVGKGIFTMANAIKGYLAYISISDIVKSVAEYQGLLRRFQAIAEAGGMKEVAAKAFAKSEFQQIFQLSRTLGLNAKIMEEGGTKFLGGAIGAGLKFSQANKMLADLSFGMAGKSLSPQAMNSTMLGFYNLLSKQKVLLPNLRQIESAMPGVVGMTEKFLKIKGGDSGLIDTLKTGKLSVNDFLLTMTKLARLKFGKTAYENVNTINGAMANLNNTVWMLQARFGEAGFMKGWVTALNKIDNLLNSKTVLNGIDKLGYGFSKFVDIIAGSIGFIQKHKIALDLLKGALVAISIALTGISAYAGIVAMIAALVNPFNAIIVAVGIFAGLGVVLYNRWRPFRNFIDELVIKFEKLINLASNFVGQKALFSDKLIKSQEQNLNISLLQESKSNPYVQSEVRKQNNANFNAHVRVSAEKGTTVTKANYNTTGSNKNNIGFNAGRKGSLNGAFA